MPPCNRSPRSSRPAVFSKVNNGAHYYLTPREMRVSFKKLHFQHETGQIEFTPVLPETASAARFLVAAASTGPASDLEQAWRS